MIVFTVYFKKINFLVGLHLLQPKNNAFIREILFLIENTSVKTIEIKNIMHVTLGYWADFYQKTDDVQRKKSYSVSLPNSCGRMLAANNCLPQPVFFQLTETDAGCFQARLFPYCYLFLTLEVNFATLFFYN